MLSKKDLGSSFAQGRERVVSWNQVQKQFVQAVSTAAVQEIETKSVLTAFFASQPTKYRGLQRFFHYFCDKVAIEPAQSRSSCSHI